MLQKNLFDPPFLWKAKNLSPIVGTLSTILVKKASLGLLNFLTSINQKYRILKHSRTELIQDVTGEGVFSNGFHLLALREESLDGKKNWYDVNDAKLQEIVTNLNGSDHCLILRAKNIGAWLNVQGTTATGTVLSSTEVHIFCVHVMMLSPLTPRSNATAVAHILMYVTYLSVEKEASSSHITIKCVLDSYTSLNYPLRQPLYTANPSSNRAT